MRKPILQFIAGDALGLSIAGTSAAGRESPNVPAAGTIGIDINPVAIRRIIGAVVVGRVRCHLLLSPTVYGDTKDIEVTAVPLADEGQPFAIRRPAVKITGMIRGEEARFCAAFGCSDEYLRLWRQTILCGECQQLAVRRQAVVVVAFVGGIESQFFRLRFLVTFKRKTVKLALGVREQILSIGRPVRRFPKFVRRVYDANAFTLQIVNRDRATYVAGILISVLLWPRSL